MALTSTLYRFTIDLSDIERQRYETLRLRIAMHPSETAPYLLTRVLAYALNEQPGIEFSAGLSTPDEPAICVRDLTGLLSLWIEIGNPSAKRLHRASKACNRVRVYTYRDPAICIRECVGESIHRKDQIELFAFAPAFLMELEKHLARDNAWSVLVSGTEITVGMAGHSIEGEVGVHRLST